MPPRFHRVWSAAPVEPLRLRPDKAGSAPRRSEEQACRCGFIRLNF